MAAVLSNGKGFYHPLVYVLESHRLGLSFLQPSINEPGPKFEVHGNKIRVPLSLAKGLTEKNVDRIYCDRFFFERDFLAIQPPSAQFLEGHARRVFGLV